DALPRALYVPRLQVVDDPSLIFDRLSDGAVDPRKLAIVEAPPTDGFLGGAGSATGDARILEDRSERLRVGAPATDAGFLFDSDQYDAGWTATVNGAATPILRANYAFRAVRVPSGTATVVFTYQPRTLVMGALVTLGGLGALGVYAGIAVRRR